MKNTLKTLLSRAEPYAPFTILLTFALLSLIHLESPQKMLDAYFEESAALDILDRLGESSFWSLFIQGELPTWITYHYHGLVFSYLILPFLFLFGPSWLLIKLIHLGFGLLTLLFSYLFVKEILNKRTALLALFLISINASFFVTVRLASEFASYMQTFMMGCCYFSALWWRTRKPQHLGIALFLLGLGTGCRVWFLWFVGAFVLTALVFIRDWGPVLKKFPRRQLLKTLLAAIGLLALGSSLVIYRELHLNFSSVQILLGSQFSSSNPYGYASYFGTLLEILKLFLEILTHRYYFFRMFEVDPSFQANFLFPIFLLMSVAFVGLASLQSSFPKRKRYLAVLSIFLLMLLQTPVSPSHLPFLHLYFFYPWPPILVALGITALSFLLKNLKYLHKTLVLSLLLILITASDIRSLTYHISYLGTHKGRGVCHSYTIADLAQWLEDRQLQERPVCFSENRTLAHMYFLLKPYQSIRRNWFAPHTEHHSVRKYSDSFDSHIKTTLKDDKLVFVNLNYQPQTSMLTLRQWAEDNNRKLTSLKKILEPNGTCTYEIFSLE